MTITSQRYESRPVRCLSLVDLDGWRLKVYGIAYGRPEPRPALVEAAVEAARRVLPRPRVTETRYGVGFVGAHDARGGCFAFVDWWEDENELHHHPFVGPKEDPEAIAPVPPGGSAACAWDLAVIAFERQAWVDTVLRNPDGPDLDAYLRRRMNADV